MSRRSIDIGRKRRNSPRPSLPKRGDRGEFAAAKSRHVPWAWLGGLATVLVIVAAGYILLPEAKISVSARSEPVTRDLEIGVSTAVAAPDSAKLVVPGLAVSGEAAGSKTVPSTGTRNVGSKASGFVYIYNFSKTPLILKAATTVLSAGDRKYHFTQDVTGIRPTAFIGLEQQEVDPSSLIAPVPVVADAPGEQYNLAKAARLEIANEVFGNKPKTLYATVADDGLRGGLTKVSKVITDADIQNGYKSLAADLAAQARAKLVTADADGSRLLDNAYHAEMLEQSTKGVAGREVLDFDVSAKVKIQGLTFRQSDVRQAVESRLTRLLPANQVLAGDASTRLTTKFANLNLSAGTGTLLIHYEGEITYRLDAAEIASKIRGKTEPEIRELLLSRPEIQAVQVEFHPAWVKKAPKYGQKITVDIK